ncbi:MAG: hypothetical protein WDZ45_11305 [Flavobacteriaceae bacterium]
MKKIYHLILLLFIVVGCNKDDDNKPSSESDPTTIVTQASEIINVTENTIILTGGNTNLEINDILVSGANTRAPRGFLRKITDINNVEGNIVLSTERTSIEEGLKYFSTPEDSLQASFSHTFTQTDGRTQSNRNFNIVLEIDETITVNGIDLNLNGNLEITPSLGGNIVIGRNGIGLPYLDTLELISQTENNLSITLTTETELSFDEEILLGSFQSSPITIFLGGFPVVVIPEVSLSVGANGQINATLSYSYNGNSTFTAGIRYDDNWQFPDSNGLVVNSTDASATAQVTGSAEVYIKPEFGISLYDEGFVNTGINVRPYARFAGTINTNGYEYGVYGGISAGAFFKASIFGFNLVDKEWDDLITLAEYEIISGTGNTSTPTVTTADVINITNNSAQSGGNVTDDGDSTVTSRGICWSTSPNPTTANNTTNNGSGLGSFISQLSGLSPNTTYYVRAYATNSEGTGYGNQASFTTQGSGNVSPAFNPNPANGANNIPLSAALSFTPGADTPANATFKLYFGTNPNPTTSYNLGTSTTYNYSNLQENTTYYWKVETISGSGNVLATSPIWNFSTLITTGNTQPAFNPIPNNASTNVSLNGNLSFTAGANTPTNATYKLYFDTSANPTTQYNLGGQTSYSYSNLQENTTYYWKIETLSNTGATLATSSIWNFSTETSGCIFDGDVLLQSQQEINNFGAQNYCEITGNLIIGRPFGNNTPTDIVDLTPLSSLNTIGGNLLRINYNSNLTSLGTGLSNLISFGSGFNLDIKNNQSLNNLSGFGNISVYALNIFNNDALVSLAGAENITMNSLKVDFNSSLSSFTGINSNISSLEMIGINDNDNLPSLAGLENINSIGSIFEVINNNILADYCALNNAFIGGSNLPIYDVFGNAYNPTEQDLVNGDCSQ